MVKCWVWGGQVTSILLAVTSPCLAIEPVCICVCVRESVCVKERSSLTLVSRSVLTRDQACTREFDVSRDNRLRALTAEGVLRSLE